MQSTAEEEKSKYCEKCEGFTMNYDKKTGSNFCVNENCGFIKDSHFITYQDEVNHFDNDDQDTKLKRVAEATNIMLSDGGLAFKFDSKK